MINDTILCNLELVHTVLWVVEYLSVDDILIPGIESSEWQWFQNKTKPSK